ncbi:hypothetical protein QBC37DRAFT_482281 [Rhypophila decipiens]|uniref:Uncharacterized protein n=1 Tax=Rhypophila decipiens TaxID=261697 RepID=A0AAN6Y830_9PEZI|nr:hypothetical protein QBC37DRAFT_482281 [Rhypophila decipiens]
MSESLKSTTRLMSEFMCATAQDANANSETTIRGYILAQVHSQLLACGPDSWAAPYLPVTKSGDTIWSVAKTTYVVTAWKPTTFSTVRQSGGWIVTQVQVSSVPVATWGTTEGFWVEVVTAPTVTSTDTGTGGRFILRRRRRRRRRRRSRAAEKKFDHGNLSEKGDDDWKKKPPPIEMDTEREKVEIGDGRVYHEMGSSCEAFELDAGDTEVQERTPPKKFGPEEEHVFVAKMKKNRPDSGGSNKSSKSWVTVATTDTSSSNDDHEPQIKRGGTGSEPS